MRKGDTMRIRFGTVLLLLFLTVLVGFGGVRENHAGNIVIGQAPSVADVTAPTFSSATINADAATVTLSEDVTITGLDDGDFVMTGSTTGAENLTSCTELSGVISCTATAEFVNGETVTLAYTTGANEVEDAAGNDLASFGPEAVTNNTPSSYLVSEDFDGATLCIASGVSNCQGTWTALNSGTFTFNSTASPAPLAGTYSFYGEWTGDPEPGIYRSFADQADVWIYFIINTSAVIEAGLDTSTGTRLMRLQFYPLAPNVSEGGYTSDSCGVFSNGTTYHVWLHYSASTSFSYAYINTSATRPAVTCSTEGDASANAGRFRIHLPNSGSGIIEKILVSSSEIGSNP